MQNSKPYLETLSRLKVTKARIDGPYRQDRLVGGMSCPGRWWKRDGVEIFESKNGGQIAFQKPEALRYGLR